MRRRVLAARLLAMLLLALLACAVTVPGVASLLLTLAPALLLFVALAAGYLPGARGLERLTRAMTRRRRWPAAGSIRRARRRRRRAAVLPRGGRLLADALAVRPPPLARA